MHILLVEDELHLAKSLKKILEHHNYTVDMVHNGLEVLPFVKTYCFDVIILDVMLPGLDGVNVLKQIREINTNVKIIMLTAKDLIEDKVCALDGGADDYMTKPFSSSELLARIRVCLRRKDSQIDSTSFGDLTLENNTYKLINSNGEFVLGKKEYQIMELLLENKTNIIEHHTLFDKVWNCESDVTDGVLWTYISYLRKKLRLLNSNVSIKATRGVGYKLEVSL
ncbi:MAG: response regulator transcription factor [bacterium]